MIMKKVRLQFTPPLVRVHDVQFLDSIPVQMKVHVRKPLVEERRNTHSLLIVGDFEYTGEDEPLEMQVFSQGFLLHNVPVRPSSREGRNRRYPFRIGISTLGLPASSQIMLRIHMQQGGVVDVIRVDMERHRAIPCRPTQLQPCLVTGLGRSGTTRLMQILSSHSGIACDDTYPYETRMAQYFMQKYFVGVSPALHLPNYNIDNFYNQNPSVRVGPCPYFLTPYSEGTRAEAWYSREYLPRLEKNTFRAIDKFYLTGVKRGIIRKSQPPMYFAEKFHPTHMPFLFRELYQGAREIFLVRDFRDMFASMLGFNEKRNSEDFGRATVDSDMQFLRSVGQSVTQLTTSWRQRKEGALLIHYEDMCRTPGTVASKLAEYLGFPHLDLPPPDVSNGAQHQERGMAAHATSPDAATSIGKWKTVLPPDMAEHCDLVFRPALDLFGYD